MEAFANHKENCSVAIFKSALKKKAGCAFEKHFVSLNCQMLAFEKLELRNGAEEARSRS